MLARSLSQVEGQLADLADAPASRLEQDAARFAAALPDDSVLIVFRGIQIEAYPARRLPYYPVAVPFSPPVNPVLDRAADFETRHADYAAAMTLLGRVAHAQDRWARATALLRLARIHRKRGEYLDALARYQELSTMGDSPVEAEGLPSDLVAAQARLSVFARHPDRDAARKDAKTITDGLRQRRWRLTRGVYEFYADEALRTLGPSEPVPDAPGALALAAVAASLHAQGPFVLTRSRSVIREICVPLLVLRHAGRERNAALVVGPNWLAA